MLLLVILVVCQCVFGYDTDTILEKSKEISHPNLSYRYTDDVLIVDWKVDSPERVVLMFNEHARELVTGELGLRTIQKLVEWNPKVSVTIVPVLNIWGRKKVEEGAPCLRKNRYGVDTNRNFQTEFHHYDRDSEEYEGPFPISEKESKIINDELEGATRYVNIHSGEYSIYMPHDSSYDPPPNADIMSSQIEKWSKHCPKCITGSAAKVSSYKAYGTSVDWAIQKGVPESYTFEVYGRETNDCDKMFNPSEEELEQELEPWLNILKEVLT